MGAEVKATRSKLPQPARCERMRGFIRDLNEENLEKCVDGFSQKNYIGKFQFGEVYHGKYDDCDVIVKIWRKPDKDEKSKDKVYPGDNEGRLKDEVELGEYFSLYEFHPNMAKLLDVSRGPKHLAAIYSMKPKAIGTIHSLIEQDSFTWSRRIRVAFGLASLLRYMHTPHPRCPSDVPYLIRNIDAAHVLVDEDYEALLFDFSMISGGILTDKRKLLNQNIHDSYGYIDPICSKPGKWCDRCDVFSYGVVLLSLISKRVHKDDDDSTNAPFVYKWAKNMLEEEKAKKEQEKDKKEQEKDKNAQQKPVACGAFLVHESLKSDPGFHFSDADSISNLAMKCVEDNPHKRPTMNQVVRSLQKLKIVQQNANTWECCQMLDGVNTIFHSTWYDRDNREKLYPQPLRLQWGSVSNRPKHQMRSGTNKGVCQGQARSKASIPDEEDHPLTLKAFSYDDLDDATSGFSEKNLIGKYHFGKVYRGERAGKKVIVKMWETDNYNGIGQIHNEERLKDEISLLQHPRLLSHHNLVKMIGYCFEKEGKLGAVYGLDPRDSLHNLVVKDDFTWLQRMIVIYEFANLLMFLHTPNPPHVPYRVSNIDAAHILLDQDYSPKLFDFGMTVGGIILSSRESRTKGTPQRFGYTCRGIAYEGEDVFAFGNILLCLIHKRVPTLDMGKDDRFCPFMVAKEEYEEYEKKSGILDGFSFMHKSLKRDDLNKIDGFDEEDELKLTELAMQCVDISPCLRPSMKKVVEKLQDLQAFRKPEMKKFVEKWHKLKFYSKPAKRNGHL